MANGTALQTVSTADLERLDSLARQCVGLRASANGAQVFTDAFRTSTTMVELMRAITPGMMEAVMTLMNTPIGFLTDRDPAKGGTPYPEPVVRNCLVAAVMRGARPIGNEFNIIAGAPMLVKNFYWRALNELEGLTDLRVIPGMPMMPEGDGGGVAKIRMAATWRLDGTKQQLMGPDGNPGVVLAIRVNKAMGADAVIGKAERRVLQLVLRQASGPQSGIDDDVDDPDVIDATVAEPSPPERRPRQRRTGPSAASSPAPAPAHASPPPTEEGEVISRERAANLRDLADQSGRFATPKQLGEFIAARYKVHSLEDLSPAAAADFVLRLKASP